jgi:hypothetical protein
MVINRLDIQPESWFLASDMYYKMQAPGQHGA